MPTAPSKLQRWLDVVSFLASRHFPVSTEDLWLNVPAYAAGVRGSAKEKQSVRRMFERDKDELRSLGIPVETVRYSINYGFEEESGYRLAKRDFHLPYLKRAGVPSRLPPSPRGTFGTVRNRTKQ